MPGKVGAKGDKGPEGHTVSGICILEYCKNAKSTVIRENRIFCSLTLIKPTLQLEEELQEQFFTLFRLH